MSKREKKNLFIVNSLLNLMLAIQVKREFLSDEHVEIVITDTTSSFKEIYKRGHLQCIFDKVYLGEYMDYEINKKKFFNPKYALEGMIHDVPQKYSDIFFWNQDYILYNFVKWNNIARHKCNYHLYGDAISAYIADSPDGKSDSGKYRGKKSNILNALDKYIFKYTRVADMDYDYYMFNSNMFLGTTKRNLINISPINCFDIEIKNIFNSLFDYNGYTIQSKYIYLDTARDGFITDEDVLQIINKIIGFVGKENLIIKPHPRVDISIYENLGVEIFDRDVPWECYCLNNDIRDKVLISSLTSAVVMPYILYGMISPVVCVCDMIPNSHPELEGLKSVLKSINDKEHNFVFLSDEKEMEQYFHNS